jgi:hypothetical protein
LNIVECADHPGAAANFPVLHGEFESVSYCLT